MTMPDLGQLLDPARFPNIYPQIGAILGYLFERANTTPALAELSVTPDGHLVGKTQVTGDNGHILYMGRETDLRANT